MNARPSKIEWAVDLVKSTAKRSTCCRRHVGCVLLNKRGHVIATGYNGVASGLPHCNNINTKHLVDLNSTSIESYEKKVENLRLMYPNACSGAFSPSGTNLDGCHAIHAEQNAMLQCRDVYDIDYCVVSASPCMTCTKLLLNTSCESIIFLEDYPHSESQKLWESAGRTWIKLA